MRKISKILRLLCCSALLVQIASCELIDFDVDSDLSQIAAQMKLNFDTAYVYQGYIVHVTPSFEPDSLNISDVYITSSDSTVVSVNMLTGQIQAVGVGWATLYVESVSAQIEDSCYVCVMEPWPTAASTYPYETIFYADVTVKGEPLNANMVVAAFINGECRGLGETQTFHGIDLMQLRVGGEDLFGNVYPPKTSQDDDEEEGEDEDDEDDEGEDKDNDQNEDDNTVTNDNGNGNTNDEDDDDDDIWSIFDDDDNDDDNQGDVFVPSDKPLPITFRCYDKKKLKLYEATVTPDFDGGTHGTLSKLYKINFK